MKITKNQLRKIIKEELQNEDARDLRQIAAKKVGRIIRGTDFEEETLPRSPEELIKLLNKIKSHLYVAVKSVDPMIKNSMDNVNAYNQLHPLTMKVQAAIAELGPKLEPEFARSQDPESTEGPYGDTASYEKGKKMGRHQANTRSQPLPIDQREFVEKLLPGVKDLTAAEIGFQHGWRTIKPLSEQK